MRDRIPQIPLLRYTIPTMQRAISRNFYLIGLYRFLSSSFFFIPVILLLFKNLGLNSFHFFIAQVVFNASRLVFEIPSGYLSDRWSRKGTLVLAAACEMVAIGLYSISTEFWQIVLAEFVFGVGFSLLSGTDSAILFDTAIDLERESDYTAWEGKTGSIARIGTGIASLAGGGLAAVYLRLPFMCSAVTCGIMVMLGLLLLEPSRHRKSTHTHRETIMKVLRLLISTPRILALSGIFGLVMSTGVIVVCWGSLMLYTQFGWSSIVLGGLFAAMQATSFCGGWFSRAHPNGHWFIWLCPLGMGLCMLLMAVVPPVWVVPVVLVCGFLWNYTLPQVTTEINAQVSSDIRATVLSVAGMAQSILYIVLGLAFGWAGQAYSVRIALFGIGILLILGVVSLIPLVHQQTKKN